MLLWLAILLELVLLGAVIAAHLRDRQGLKKFVDVAADPERLKDSAMRLPAAYRAPATQFAGELARKGSLDELIVQAVTQAANTNYGFPIGLRLLFGAILSFLVLAPLAAALISTAQLLETVKSSAEGLSGTRAFLAIKGVLEPAFGALQSASHATGWLFTGLVIIGAVHWLLNRSEVREARFVEALLEAAIAARPGTPAPVASRLSELVAPERSLTMPIAAFVFFFVAAGAGWSLLLMTADAKEANAADVYDVWSEKSREAINSRGGVTIPVWNTGGSEIQPEGPSLSILEDRLLFSHGDLLRNKDAKFDPNELIALWKNQPKPDSLSILADQRVPFSNVVEALELLPSLGIKRVYLVFKRNAPSKGKDPIFAGIPFRLRSQLVNTAFSMKLHGTTVQLNPEVLGGTSILWNKPGWAAELNQATRALIKEKSSRSAAPEVALQIDEEGLTYDKVTEILSVADSACDGNTDCGVPGLGLQFFYSM